jgi:hypothetical protein
MRLKKLIQSLLFASVVISVSLPVQAGMIATAQLQDATVTMEIGDLLRQRDWLEQQLITGGVSKVDAVTRVAAMTDTEVTEVYQRFDEVPAGGSDILIIGLVIFAVLEITGYIDVIPEK